ncbi:MAG: hypothetical protein GWP09_02475, partial [Nitrospiraceae bacterium]|nr:hypothetical protein [Nitrospiraceae bacterium]
MDLVLLFIIAILVIIVIFIIGKIFSFMVKVGLALLILFIAVSLIFALMVYYDANNLKDNFYNSTNLFLYVDNLNTSQIDGINNGVNTNVKVSNDSEINNGSNSSGGVIKNIGKVKSDVKRIGNLSNDVNYLKSKVKGQIKSKITGLVTLKLNDIDKIKPLLGF